jgi:hypothetical protein
MNLQDQVIYRCIHAACARPLPRRVNFCPYCGTGQHDGVVNPAHVARPAQAEYRAAPVPPVPAPVAAAPVPAPAAPEPVAQAAAVTPPAPVVPPPAPPPAAKIAPATPYVPAAPPRREPVRMRYWLIALLTLWLIWLYARPSPNRIEARIAEAIKASEDCRLNEAQSALIELRMTKATKEQLTRLQGAMNQAAPGCEKIEQRIKAWDDTIASVENALAANDFTRAQTRLAQFTRRYGENDETRKLRDKVAKLRAAAAPEPAPFERVEPAPKAAPSPSETSQSVRNLIDEAERALAAGNYKSASDKLETCITMVDAGNRECAAFKVHADRMQREQARCLAAGREWSADRCH